MSRDLSTNYCNDRPARAATAGAFQVSVAAFPWRGDPLQTGAWSAPRPWRTGRAGTGKNRTGYGPDRAQKCIAVSAFDDLHCLLHQPHGVAVYGLTDVLRKLSRLRPCVGAFEQRGELEAGQREEPGHDAHVTSGQFAVERDQLVTGQEVGPRLDQRILA